MALQVQVEGIPLGMLNRFRELQRVSPQVGTPSSFIHHQTHMVLQIQVEAIQRGMLNLYRALLLEQPLMAKIVSLSIPLQMHTGL